MNGVRRMRAQAGLIICIALPGVEMLLGRARRHFGTFGRKPDELSEQGDVNVFVRNDFLVVSNDAMVVGFVPPSLGR